MRAQSGRDTAQNRVVTTRPRCCLREARRIWRASGYAMGVAAATNTLGRTLARTGRTDEGIALLREAQQRFEGLVHAPFLAETEARLTEALIFAGRYPEATAGVGVPR